MSVLVTGGAGFIGSHVAASFLEDGFDVVVLDNLDPFYALGIKEHNVERCRAVGGDRFSFVEGSITDDALVESVFTDHDVDVVYHQAAKAGVRPSVEAPEQYNDNNVGGILTLLTTAADADVDRFVHASSSSVYGVPESLPYVETHPTRPRSPYAVTKLASEHYCNVFNDLYGLETVNLRYFTVYGPRMRPNMAISNFVSRCLNGDPLVIYGDGEQTRDFTYVDDVVEANHALYDAHDVAGETMNLGSSDNISIRELAEYVVDETGADVDIVHEPAKNADARHTHANVGKARDLLGYEPSTDIRTGVSRFIEWYERNREWYEPLVLNS